MTTPAVTDFGTGLAADVEVLIDNISSLLLDAVTGQFANLQVYCKSIAEYTNKVVVKARDNALASNDQEFLDESTQCIKEIASSINQLVESLSGVLSKPTDPATQTVFAAASKHVGDAINKLVILSDETYQQRLLKAVSDAQGTSNRVRDSAYHSIDEMIVAVKENGSKCLSLCKLCNKAASATVDQHKKLLLTTSAEQLKRLSPDLLLAAKRVLENKAGDEVAAKEHLERKTQDISIVFDKIAEAAMIVPTTTRRLQSVLDHVRNLINLANELKKASTALTAAIAAGEPKSKIDQLRARVIDLSSAIIKEVELAAGDTAGGYRQQQIATTVKHLKEAQEKFFKALDELTANSSSQPAKDQYREADDFLSQIINKLIVLSDPNARPSSRLAYTLQDVERLAKELTAKLPTATKDEILQMTKDLEAATLQFIKDAETLLEATTDPQERQILAEQIEKVKTETSQLLSAAKMCAENRGDQACRDRFDKASRALLESASAFRAHLRKIADEEEASGASSSEAISAIKKKLLTMAHTAKKTAEELATKCNNNNPSETVAVAKRLGESVLGLSKAAEEALAELPDNSNAKQAALAQIQDTKKVGAELLTIAKTLITNSQDPNVRANVPPAVKNFSESVDSLISSFTTPEEEVSRRQKLLNRAAENMVQAASEGSAAGLVAAAKSLGENVAILEVQVDKAMAEPDTHPTKRIEMTAAMKDLKGASAAFITACKAAIIDPKNPKHLAAVSEARTVFDSRLQNVQHILITRKEGPQAQPQAAVVVQKKSVVEESELVIIAREQVSIALQMAEEATAMATKETNPARKQKILAAIADVRTAGTEVINAAEAATNDNPESLLRLDAAQVRLTNTISALATATGDASSLSTEEEELRKAMKEMNITSSGSSSAELEALAHQTIALITEFLETTSKNKLDARTTIERAKEIHARTNQLAGLLRTKVGQSTVTEAVYKEQLLNLAKILRDKAMQVKILSAVQVASQKSDDSQQVASCTMGLSTAIKDTLSTLQESSLKERVKAARGRVNAIRNLLNLWRKKR